MRLLRRPPGHPASGGRMASMLIAVCPIGVEGRLAQVRWSLLPAIVPADRDWRHGSANGAAQSRAPAPTRQRLVSPKVGLASAPQATASMVDYVYPPRDVRPTVACRFITHVFNSREGRMLAESVTKTPIDRSQTYVCRFSCGFETNWPAARGRHEAARHNGHAPAHATARSISGKGNGKPAGKSRPLAAPANYFPVRK